MPGREPEIHEEAQLELDEAALWYEARADGLGLEFLEEVRQALVRVKATPHLWEKHPGIVNGHRVVVHRFPYAIIYRCSPNRIQVLAFAHFKRKPGYWKRRLRPRPEER